MLEINELKMNEPGSLTEEPPNLLMETIYYLHSYLLSTHNRPKVVLGSKDIKINERQMPILKRAYRLAVVWWWGVGGQQTLKMSQREHN